MSLFQAKPTEHRILMAIVGAERVLKGNVPFSAVGKYGRVVNKVAERIFPELPAHEATERFMEEISFLVKSGMLVCDGDLVWWTGKPFGGSRSEVTGRVLGDVTASYLVSLRSIEAKLDRIFDVITSQASAAPQPSPAAEIKKAAGRLYARAKQLEEEENVL